ncbi:MAG: helix-turn-helix domain-containing protein [Armatimonadetes bacterium]|nr:helix-turn-helix domain-containing protein [Armatimonadota bacterium]MBS1726029.1 helix-turn-helix transcriptional regulator [Armatimonadota bacterium]
MTEEENRLRLGIAKIREESRVSQRQLSELLGLHPMTIGKIERGERAISVIELIRIAEVLQKSPADLIRLAVFEG